MPKRTDIKSILIIGSGPIVIGQACEFDYSGTQGCRVLKEEGYRVILVNSNPATIMTDPMYGDATYIEPLTVKSLSKIIKKERPDAILPTLGGQTAINLATDLNNEGLLEKYSVRLIGANASSIEKCENRRIFKNIIQDLGLDIPKSAFAYSLEEAKQAIKIVGFPAIIRPSFTLGGTGANTAYNMDEYLEYVQKALHLSPTSEVLIEESILGWKEFELEVVRDKADNVIIICSIENIDAMGVHTGDSITVAPSQTLSDKEYQQMRDWAKKIIRAVGVDTGGSNIQFAVNPKTGRMTVIEMNPRVSRSSALASKATGFPIAKIAAKLAVGYTLDEIQNDITKETLASFEPTIDYVVTKIPRFSFEKFKNTPPYLGTQMQSVGETMSIGRTFKESIQKAFRSLETGRDGFGGDGKEIKEITELEKMLRKPHPERFFYLKSAFQIGLSIETVYNLTSIDPWFLHQLYDLVRIDKELIKYRPAVKAAGLSSLDPDYFIKLKKFGYSDKQIAHLLNIDVSEVRRYKKEKLISATFKAVDTCGGEFKALTPYYYSSYEKMNESSSSNNKKVIILGGGPNRIGQGIEFDYCCVHALLALKESGYEAIMINSNPETVSTDYDIATKLYFEPLTFEDVLNVVEHEQPSGIIIQFGGQTPLKLALELYAAGLPILGTSPYNIDLAENREKFGSLLKRLNIKQPEHGCGYSFNEVRSVASKIGYPVLVRPSYVLGGRAMEIVYDEKQLEKYIKAATQCSPDHPILVDKFLENALEIDVDAISDGVDTVIGATMEHIEEAGIHSGDSSCVIPPKGIKPKTLAEIKRITFDLACSLQIKGLINIQFAIKNDAVYVLEVNPRASRTVPFVSKAIGVPLAKLATNIMLGKTLRELGFTKEVNLPFYVVKAPVIPFSKFPKTQILLSPEMKSTGEVMGVDSTFGNAFAKSQISAGNSLPTSGTVFISLNDFDKSKIIDTAKELKGMGFNLIATKGTASYLNGKKISCESVYKVNEGRPNIVDLMLNDEVQLIINTPLGKESRFDEAPIRNTAVLKNIPMISTTAAAKASVDGIKSLISDSFQYKTLQDYHLLVKKYNLEKNKSLKIMTNIRPSENRPYSA